MFRRIGINENCAEFVPNHFLPIIQDSRKVLVKRHASYNSCPTPRHASYNSCPTPIKKLLKPCI